MNAAARLVEDAAARERALAIASFIVEAPAGAGKTELLTQRYLRLLAAVEQPEEVLALTFTNKAATEMRDRILGSLEIAAACVPPALAHKQQTFVLAGRVLAHDAACGWNLLGHPGRLRITTLDALCASLARQMPYLSRFGSQPAVAEDAAAHYAAAARRTLEMVEAGDADAEVVAAALAFMDNHAGRLEKLLVTMLARRDQWLHHAGRLDDGGLRTEVGAGFAALVERDLAAAGELLDSRWQQQLMPLVRFAAANAPDGLESLCDWSVPLTADVDDLPRWRALAGLLLTGQGSVRKSLTKNVGFPAGKEFAAQKEAMTEVLADLAALPGIEQRLGVLGQLPPPRLSADEWATVENFARLLRLAAGQLWLVFQEADEVDFIEIAARAGLALGDDEAPTDLAQALDYRIRHLLVDEFQDTSPTQVALIAKLTRGWMPDDGRTLFVVGDPMQSIYRFRKADVGLFLRVRERGIGDIRLEHLRLFRNNRSWPAIVDWVNAAFPSIFPAADAPETGAVRYAPSAATRPARDDSAVLVHALIADDGDDAAGTEARRVLDIIRETRRAAPAESIAVLVRARSHLDALVAEIRRSAPELRFQAVDIEGLADRQHVQDLLTLFRALYHRADRVHWLALLRAPWCGLTLADLYALAGDDRHRTIWQLMQDESRLARLSADGQTRLRQVREVLRLVFAGRDRQHPRRWLEAVWLLLGGPRCLESPAALADVEAFFALFDRLAAAGRLDAETLAARASELFAPADPQGGAVQMMTVHKSKGLEFDTVIVPGLHRETGANDSSLLLWDEVAGPDGGEHLLVAPLKARGADAGEPTAYDYLRRLESERAGHEDERLLYVAATRAIRRLHLVGVAVADERKEDGLRPPPVGSLLKLLWPGVAQPVFAAALAEHAPAVSAAAPLDPATFVPLLLRLAAPGIPSELRVPPVVDDNGGQPCEFDVVPAAATPEAALGTLVHRALELIARDGPAAWTTSRVSALAPAWQRWLQAQGQAPETASAAADDAVAAVCRTLASATGRWLLAGHAEAGAEQAWSSHDADGNVAHHVIDRCFIADGCRWIVDYKTVHLPDDELAARAVQFRPQLERYAALFVDGGLPLRLAIYFPLQDRLVELD
ncbi:UvrD-helicase domain-containing protein [Azonexus sp.]|jgi:ATP-dependent exoDNAse (exonuclease V) beta subunit|uniref:UvrD-helicase domain-containing protein n=1 Tax=Azonexus sp. TaxID=1872668 RepID=UPI002819BB6A|nr:UvrD-helicase domain-containing protein [Azonexus sp.]MDR1994882.1 UvrD-helicase domain-containing protein [Azonexus sp.]